MELGIDPEELTNPWVAAFSSAVSFILGAALPLIAALVANGTVVIVVTLITLALTGFLSAHISDTTRSRSVVRLVIGGALGLAVTYGAGLLFGAV